MFDVISDIHGCFHELCDLMEKLGHRKEEFGGTHILSSGRQIVLVGDVVDRGPDPITCAVWARAMVENGSALWVLGNHDQKFMRWSKGNKVKVSHGLDRTIAQVQDLGIDAKDLGAFIGSLPHHLVLDGGKLVVVHAAWRDDFFGRDTSKGEARSWCLYGPTTGKTLENGLPDRIDWAGQRQVTEESPWIVYGHQPYPEPHLMNRTAGIDTGCVFGGKLTALRWPEMEIVSVDARKQYSEHPVVREGD